MTTVLADFHLRRAIERLRDGLFDTIAMHRLTIAEEPIKEKFTQGLAAVELGLSTHLCICGSYGQGKSHMLAQLKQEALLQGYAASLVQLDLREVPFHQFAGVYYNLIKQLVLPDGNKFMTMWQHWGSRHAEQAAKCLTIMPHRFQMILLAMLNNKDWPHNHSWTSEEHNVQLNSSAETSAALLTAAFMGEVLPVRQLKNIFKTQNIDGYQKQSMLCRGNQPYVQMIQSLGVLLHMMGYKGWVILFDEAESITQGRLAQRAKSYAILERLFKDHGYLYSIFAYTEDFFEQIHHEEYQDIKQTFADNYADSWVDLNIERLQNFSAAGWDSLQERLIQLYSEAYCIDFSKQLPKIKAKLHNLLEKLQTQETRFKLKALVSQLDIETQALGYQ